MQPNSASQQYPSSGYQSDVQHRPGFVTPPGQAAVTRVRPWAVALTAGIVMTVLIAAIGNPKVSDSILRHVVGNDYDPNDFWDNAGRSFTTFAWRFSPRGSEDFGRVWISGVIFVLLTIALTYLFTLALSRGKRGFGGSFFAAWTSVVFAVVIASYVRASIADLKQLTGQNQSKPVAVFFSQYSPAQYAIFAALLFGLIVALLAGLVGALSSTTTYFLDPASAHAPLDGGGVEPVAAPEPQEREVWAAPPPPGPISSPSPWTTPERSDRPDLDKRDARDEPQPTAVLPVMGRDHGDAQRRADDESESTQAYRVPREDEATQAHRVQPEDRVQPQDEGESTQAYRVRPEDERDRP